MFVNPSATTNIRPEEVFGSTTVPSKQDLRSYYYVNKIFPRKLFDSLYKSELDPSRII
jgi:hypothetical protein